MQQLNEFLIARFGPLGPVVAVGLLGLLLVLSVLPVLLKKQIDPFSRFRDTVKPSAGTTAAKAKGAEQTLRAARGGDKLAKFATFLEPKTAEEMTTARMRMTRAGYRGKHAVRTFHAIQFTLGMICLLIGVGYAIFASTTGEISTTKLLVSVLGPACVGYYLPKYWVERRVQTRQTEMQNGFPDALDLLLVCVEAGQSLDQGIIRVSKEMTAGYPALAEEFEVVAQEVKAGKDKTSVLRSFSERCGVPDVASFVTVMIQSATFGTSIAEALRVYSAEMRDKRVMRAEEAANKLPTKITLGTMLFTVPPLLIILVGPSVHDMMNAFENF